MVEAYLDDHGIEVIRKSGTTIDSNYAIRTLSQGAIPSNWDTINITYPSATTESYQFVLDSVIQKTILLTYSDSTKATLTTVAVS